MTDKQNKKTPDGLIETPVRYDGQYLYDDGFDPNVPIAELDPMGCLDDVFIQATAEQICATINEHARLVTHLQQVEHERDAMREALEHYADELNWMIGGSQITIPRLTNLYTPVDKWMKLQKKNGYDIAREALAVK